MVYFVLKVADCTRVAWIGATVILCNESFADYQAGTAGA